VDEPARILILLLAVCAACTGLCGLFIFWLWSKVRALEAQLRRYRADQRADRVKLDDLEPARQRALRQRARREAHERQVEQALAARGRAH
jgi:hypothetical protein